MSNSKVKQVGVNTWKVGQSVIVRDVNASKPYSVSGPMPYQMCEFRTFENAIACAQVYESERKA